MTATNINVVLEQAASFEAGFPVDDVISGLVCEGIAAEDISAFEVVYQNTSNQFALADADAPSTMPVVAMAKADISKGDNGQFLLLGLARNNDWAFTAGEILYAGTTAGAITGTAPSGGADVIQPIGVARASGIIYFHPEILLEVATHIIEHHTADDTLTKEESGSVHTNLGEDGAMTLTLPQDAPAGCYFHFAVMYAGELRIDPGAAGAIYITGAKQTDNKYITANDEAESIMLVADGNGDWVSLYETGTWGVEA